MKYVGNIVIGFIVYFVIQVLTMLIGSALGPGPYEVGYVVTSISLLCAIVVVCTLIIVDTIKSYNHFMHKNDTKEGLTVDCDLSDKQ
ncbi:MAG: hypothetical protein ACYDEJ_08640 [Desulfitobacteriaceae bacterium]